ncbi:PAC2 family protein [Urbifossiella limnaea]|uniref:PAC2 family protein n=1 Tax=Urbifossiella limnaea TaxID=2528023 RepID=A0A517XR23_9BACT|nr:PAC2 family protein [Urbifossiella limnaea]QDU19939.1 PAC2 family protein [Urbifossiella limnaea]
MPENLKLTRPWLVAVWPGMGHVGINAGVYLLSKLGMSEVAELETGETFDVDSVTVENGLIGAVRRPRSRLFLWNDPAGKHDLVVLVGEAQPPAGKYAFCRRVIDAARQAGVERVFTFAAMATQMHPSHDSRVFAAATDQANLDELKRLELDVVQEGQISGLNGVLLGVAAEAGLPGACLLGEMPHIFAQVPFPKASHAVLEAFTTLAGIELDLSELASLARNVEEQLGEVLARVEERFGDQEDEDDEDDDSEAVAEAEEPEAGDEPSPAARRPSARARVEELFVAAAADRSKAFELKQALDRFGLFREYEDRFLDLFKKAGEAGA